MSQENVEIVKAAFEAYLRNDEITMRELTDPEVVLSSRPDQPDAGEDRGYEGLLRMSAEWVEAWEGHTIEAVRIQDHGDLVFVSTREQGRGRTSGILIESEAMFVMTVRLGKIVRIEIFGSEREALEATEGRAAERG
jgi:ketosteroid isomerase-like protein